MATCIDGVIDELGGIAERMKQDVLECRRLRVEFGAPLELAEPVGIRVICAWCKAELSGNREAARVSHGICPACARKVVGQ